MSTNARSERRHRIRLVPLALEQNECATPPAHHSGRPQSGSCSLFCVCPSSSAGARNSLGTTTSETSDCFKSFLLVVRHRNQTTCLPQLLDLHRSAALKILHLLTRGTVFFQSVRAPLAHPLNDEPRFCRAVNHASPVCGLRQHLVVG